MEVSDKVDEDIFALSPEYGGDDGEGMLDDDALSAKFKSDREMWTARIKDLTEDFRDIHKLVDVQVSLYSWRQVILEHNHWLMGMYYKMETSYKRKCSKYWEINAKNGKTKVTDQKVLVEAQLAPLKENMNVLESQIGFFKGTIDTLDHFIFGLRHRVGLEDYKRG